MSSKTVDDDGIPAQTVVRSDKNKDVNQAALDVSGPAPVAQADDPEMDEAGVSSLVLALQNMVAEMENHAKATGQPMPTIPGVALLGQSPKLIAMDPVAIGSLRALEQNVRGMAGQDMLEKAGDMALGAAAIGAASSVNAPAAASMSQAAVLSMLMGGDKAAYYAEKLGGNEKISAIGQGWLDALMEGAALKKEQDGPVMQEGMEHFVSVDHGLGGRGLGRSQGLDVGQGVGRSMNS